MEGVAESSGKRTWTTAEIIRFWWAERWFNSGRIYRRRSCQLIWF